MTELRELDAEIHLTVMGEQCNWFEGMGDYCYPSLLDLDADLRPWPVPVPRYSSDIAAAWKVVEKMRERFTNVVLYGDNGWALALWNISAEGKHSYAPGSVNADTAPLAICRAALAAVRAAKPASSDHSQPRKSDPSSQPD